MTTAILLIAGSLLCAWATLRCVGNECERRLRTLEGQVRAEREAAVAATEAAAAAPRMLSGGPASTPAPAPAPAPAGAGAGAGAGASGKVPALAAAGKTSGKR